MAKVLKSIEGGTPSKYISEKLDKMQDCYSDLKNFWEDNADDLESDQKRLIYASVLIFLLGFLFSQIFIYVTKKPLNEYLAETSAPQNLTLYESKIEDFIDYASKANGGLVLEEYSTPEYLGWFKYFSSNKRESVISEDNASGSCWAFNGSYGQIGIQLAAKIFPKHFSIFHINSLNYAVAPKRIRVYSLDFEDETKLLAEFEFDLSIKGEFRKKWGLFECKYHCDIAVSKIVLEVNENHGAGGTCVYQFRVHGIPEN